MTALSVQFQMAKWEMVNAAFFDFSSWIGTPYTCNQHTTRGLTENESVYDLGSVKLIFLKVVLFQFYGCGNPQNDVNPNF